MSLLTLQAHPGAAASSRVAPALKLTDDEKARPSDGNVVAQWNRIH
jgi:hypothetical protein